MKKWALQLLVSALSVLLAAEILKGVHLGNTLSALLVALVLSFLNTFLKPILLILTIPVTLFTFGLFLLVINAAIILIADNLLDSFSVDNFWWALLFSLVVSFANSILNSMLGTGDDKKGNED